MTTLKLAFAPATRPRTTGGDCRHCISPEDNVDFGACKYVVATNNLGKCLNYERLTSSVLKFDDCDADVRACDRDDNDGESTNHGDTQLFPV